MGWNNQHIDRSELWKIASVVVATLVTAGLPTWIVFEAMRHSG